MCIAKTINGPKCKKSPQKKYCYIHNVSKLSLVSEKANILHRFLPGELVDKVLSFLPFNEGRCIVNGRTPLKISVNKGFLKSSHIRHISYVQADNITLHIPDYERFVRISDNVYLSFIHKYAPQTRTLFEFQQYIDIMPRNQAIDMRQKVLDELKN